MLDFTEIILLLNKKLKNTFFLAFLGDVLQILEIPKYLTAP